MIGFVQKDVKGRGDGETSRKRESGESKERGERREVNVCEVRER